jgi:threonine synthase
LVENKPVRFFGAQATGCSPIAHAVKNGLAHHEPQRPNTIARSLAIGNPADGLYATRAIRSSGGWSEDVSDAEIVTSMELLATTEGIFGETAAGVTVGCAKSLIEQGRIRPDEETVLCVTGNGLKTTDALAGRYAVEDAIEPRLAAFEKYIGQAMAVSAVS